MNLSAVAYATNTAPAGRMLAVPIHVDHQLGTTTSHLSAEVSFDESSYGSRVRVTTGSPWSGTRPEQASYH